MAQRIYIVESRDARDAAGNPVRPRLVRAPNAAQALRHVAADSFVVNVASQDDVYLNAMAGVKVEDSGSAATAAVDAGGAA